MIGALFLMMLQLAIENTLRFCGSFLGAILLSAALWLTFGFFVVSIILGSM